MQSSDRRNYFKVNDKETKRKKENYELSNCSKWYILISNLFMSIFVPTGIVPKYILSLPMQVSLSICLSQLVWPFIFTEKSDCDKINFVLSMISVTTILLKLLQMISELY